MMNAKTYTPRESEIERRWYVVDATDETLGRLATRIARVLEGKNKPTYAAHMDTGDHVIVLNAARITVTSDKLDDQGLRPPQRLSRRASRRRPSATCSPAGRRRSSAAPSRACCRTTASAPSSSASSRSTPGTSIPHQAQQPEPLA